MSDRLFKEVQLQEGALVQFVGCHVVKWPYDLMQPTIGFVEVEQQALESACTGIEFTADPTGTVKALVEAGGRLLDIICLVNEYTSGDDLYSRYGIDREELAELCRKTNAALARVRMDEAEKVAHKEKPFGFWPD